MKYKNIGVIFPSSYSPPDLIAKTFSVFKNKGFNIITARDSFKNINGFAGSDKERINEIHSIYSNPNVDIVIAFAGGVGLSRIVDDIDYSIIKKSGKFLLGYSDLTLLHNAIIKNTDLISYHSPMLEWASRDNVDKNSQEYFFDFLNGEINLSLQNELFKDIKILKGTNIDKISAKTIGGNLEALVSSIGTKNDFDTKDKIFLIENVGNKITMVHEMLYHLKRSRKFDNIKALLIGGMNYIELEDGFYSNVENIILDMFQDKNFPIISNLPFGHDKQKIIMPLNKKISINTLENKIII